MIRKKIYRQHHPYIKDILKYLKIGSIILSILLFLFFGWVAVALGEMRFIIPHISEIAGFKKEKNYLILLHNEGEMRPTLGFLSAFAILSINKGIPALSFYDSYHVADPNNYISPPSALEEILGKDEKYNGWTFRDSNFSPDFQTNAELAKKFLLEDPHFSNFQFDGVIGMNMIPLGKIVDTLQTITWEGKNLSSQNFFSILEFSAKDFDHHDFDEWKNRKSSFGELANHLLFQVITTPSQWDDVIEVIRKEADNQNILFSFKNHEIQESFQKRNWTGKIDNNFWGINLANIGGRKGDRYITKSYSSDFFVDYNGSITETIRINMSHHGTRTLHSDEYFAFIRIYRPGKIELQGYEGGYINEPKLSTLPEFSNTSEIGFFIHLSPGQEKNWEITLTHPQLTSNSTLEINTLAQSGGGFTDWDVVFRGNGDISFSAHQCLQKWSRENILWCKRDLQEKNPLSITKNPDTTPPLLESSKFVTDKQIEIFFSEPLTSVEIEDIIFTEKANGLQIPIEEVITQDKKIIITLKKPLDITSKRFLTLSIHNLRDVFLNQQDEFFITTLVTKK